MVYVRRRYYFWLFKAYFKKWKRTILLSVFLGGAVFCALFLFLNYASANLFKNSTEKIGYSGSYTVNTLPAEILSYVSYGLTKVEKDGSITPAAAQEYAVSNDGKTITFKLKKDLKFSSGNTFTAEDISYTFKDVKTEIKDPYTIVFHTTTPYAPFLSVVSKPILSGNVGLGDFKIGKTEQNAGFLKSLTLQNKHDGTKKIFYFYPTQDALQTAFLLGEVDRIENVSSKDVPEEFYKDFSNVTVSKSTNYKVLVTAFFNTIDATLSNKKVRQALVYALPEKFKEGERTHSFLPPHSLYYTQSPNEGLMDLELANELLASSGSAEFDLTITTTNELVETAKELAKGWERLGIKSTIVTSQDIPPSYQVLLYPMSLPLDPDMYSIWHSNQPNNITHYSNVRIDKLLEDGRTTTNSADREQIYADLQKYLLDDAPAAFLYFPHDYTVMRKN